MKEQKLDEELQIIFASNPNKIIRHGNLLILIILASILGLGFVIKFPETVNGNVSLYSSPSTATMVTKSSGRINLMVKEGQRIQKNQVLAYIETPANFNHISYFAKYLDSMYKILNSGNAYEIGDSSPSLLNLGDLNPYYISLISSLNTFHEHRRYNNFGLNKNDLEIQIKNAIALRKKYEEDREIAKKELLLMSEKFKRDSLLYSKKVISLNEFENSRLSFLPFQRKYDQIIQNLITAATQLNSLQTQNKSISNEKSLKDIQVLADLKSSLSTARTQTELWMERNVIRSPINGSVALNNTWSDYQNVTIGQEVMSILPTKLGVVAKASIVAAGSGKLKVNDNAIIQLDDYPQEEFGIITGIVQSLPSFQKDGQYVVLLNLNDGLITSFKKAVPLKEGMSGSVRIVTNDTTLIERVFYNLRKALTSFSQ